MIFCWFVAGRIFEVERVASIMEEIVLEIHKQLVSPHQEQSTSIGHVCDVATEMFQQFKDRIAYLYKPTLSVLLLSKRLVYEL